MLIPNLIIKRVKIIFKNIFKNTLNNRSKYVYSISIKF